jgi:hypothetical protein
MQEYLSLIFLHHLARPAAGKLVLFGGTACRFSILMLFAIDNEPIFAVEYVESQAVLMSWLAHIQMNHE